MKKILIVAAASAVALTAAGLGGWWFGTEHAAPAPVVAVKTGQPTTANAAETAALANLLAQSYPDNHGKAQALGQWSGKVMVVNYWATWCPPCREEMPSFSRLQGQYADKGVQFVGIAIDSADKVAQFQKNTPVIYPLLIGEVSAIDQTVALGNAMQALPFTVLIGRDGKIAGTKLGRFEDADLEAQIKALL